MIGGWAEPRGRHFRVYFFFQVGEEEEEERKNKRERFSEVLYLGGFYYLVKEGFVYLYKKIVKFSENGKVIIMFGSNHT